jgi:replication fork clamp-binding protein CrfC
LVQSHSEKEFAEFVERRGEPFENMAEFRAEIQAQTDKVCGQNKGISSVPLRLRFHSRRVVELLLVDLPGIVKNPKGDQPSDIEQQVLQMVRTYIRNPHCIIVAVSKATDDSANSESLKLAREVDKTGVRTIGVLTHVDLVEGSVNALRDYGTLSNQLSLGHVCVDLRPPTATHAIDEQLKKEREFFENHEQYRAVADKMGVPFLVKTMNMVLLRHIKAELPTIRESVAWAL